MFKYLFFGLVIIVLIFPLQAFAQERGFLGGPIVPCGIKSDPQRADDCTLCDIFVLAKNIINFLFELTLVIAPIFVLIGGGTILLSAGSPAKIDLGKKIILSTVIGIVIALVSWTVLNMLFNNFIAPNVAPWPWYEPRCEGGGIIESGFCHLQYQYAPDVMFANYKTTQQCRQECSQQCTSDCESWCCLSEDMSGQEDVCSQGPSTKGQYCVCETPRYNGDAPNLDKVIYTDVKVSDLNSEENCQMQCISSNFSNYCSRSEINLPLEKYNIRCVDLATANSIRACSVRLTTATLGSGCMVGTTCYTSDNECMIAATTTYRDRCYLDNVSLCDSYQFGYSTFCTTGSQRGLCGNRSDRYVLWQWRDEATAGYGMQSAYDCSRISYGNTGTYCRVNCQYNRCTTPIVDRCEERSPAGSCFNGQYTCQLGVRDQENEACTELRDLLNCMSSRLPVAAKELSSIADNSPFLGGSLPGCFKQWITQCSSSEDSCTGECCGHSICSLHYGGKANMVDSISQRIKDECGIGTIDCRRCSWAVDFAREDYVTEIRTAAQQCAEQLWDGNLEEIYIAPEGDHIHVGLTGVAQYYRCR